MLNLGHNYFFPFFFFDGVFYSSVFIPVHIKAEHTLLGVLLALEAPLACAGVDPLLSFSTRAGLLLPEAEAELGAVLTF